MGIIGKVKQLISTPVQMWAEFTASPPTLSDGDQAPLQLDATGNLKTTSSGGAVTGNQGTPAATANAWPVKVTDATNIAAVKPVSTASAFGGDPALVVEMRPGGLFPASAVSTVDSMGTGITVTKIIAHISGFNGTGWDRIRASIAGVQTSVLGFINNLPYGQFNLTKPTLSDTNYAPPQVDANGNARVAEQFSPGYENNGAGVAYTLGRAIPTSDGSWTLTSSAGTPIGAAGVAVKAAPGRIRRISVTNKNATTGFYIMLFNQTTSPTNGTAPLDRFWVPERDATAKDTLNSVMIEFGPEGRYLSTGISIAASSTVDTLTLLGTADCHYCVDWT